MEFNETLIANNLEATNAREVIEALADRLHAAGFVSAEYGAQTWAREQVHPTGLPTKPFCIAFPHADAQGVNRSALAVASMKEPVRFKNMADPEEDLDILLVFMLANRSPEEQIETLRNLALLFGQPEKLIALRSQPTPQEVVAWLKHELRLSPDDEETIESRKGGLPKDYQ